MVKLYKGSASFHGRKILWLGDYSKVEEAIGTWLKVHSKGLPVFGTMILMKAKEFALLMNTDDFQVSAGWLFPF
jgi:hypothetical protein